MRARPDSVRREVAGAAQLRRGRVLAADGTLAGVAGVAGAGGSSGVFERGHASASFDYL